MTTTDDARLVEIEARMAARDTFPYIESEEDVRYLLDRLKAAESRIRELEEMMAIAFALMPPPRALRADEVQEEGNGG